jgi:HEAT repeat protein
MRTFGALAIVLTACLAGCSGQQGPLLSHGKPVDHWLEELRSPEVKTRKKAVIALGHVGSADSRAIPALTAAVKDPDPTIRKEAVLALLNIGPPARDAIPTLRDAERDKDAGVRVSAGKAIARIQSGQ